MSEAVAHISKIYYLNRLTPACLLHLCPYPRLRRVRCQLNATWRLATRPSDDAEFTSPSYLYSAPFSRVSTSSLSGRWMCFPASSIAMSQQCCSTYPLELQQQLQKAKLAWLTVNSTLQQNIPEYAVKSSTEKGHRIKLHKRSEQTPLSNAATEHPNHQPHTPVPHTPVTYYHNIEGTTLDSSSTLSSTPTVPTPPSHALTNRSRQTVPTSAEQTITIPIHRRD